MIYEMDCNYSRKNDFIVFKEEDPIKDRIFSENLLYLGKSVINQWDKPTLYPLKPIDKYRKVDFPSCRYFCMNSKAKAFFKDNIEGDYEFLPFDFLGEEHYFLNVFTTFNMYDVLSLNDNEFKYLPRLQDYPLFPLNPVFKKDFIYPNVFKVKESIMPIYVTKEIRDKLIKSGLTGIRFQEYQTK